MTRRRAALLLAATVVTGSALSGCGADGRVDAAREVARQYEEAVKGGDAEAVCRLLAPVTRQAAMDESGTCAKAVSEAQLDDPGTVGTPQVWGRSAMVRFDRGAGSTVFLTDADGRWQLTAVGCTEQPDAPATCELEAG